MTKQATYYHNPRCSKSRQGLELLETHGFDFVIKHYLKEEMTEKEVLLLISNLGDQDITAMVRKKETAYKDLDIDVKSMTAKKWAKIIVNNPSILERPLLATSLVTSIGRPPENFLAIITDT
jgi:arsenate reductase